jgi:hypothetical protein
LVCVAWARDESPTPPEESRVTVSPENSLRRGFGSRPSGHDDGSFQSSEAGPSRWWIFTRSNLPQGGEVNQQTPADLDNERITQSLPEKFNALATPATIQDVRRPETQEDTTQSTSQNPRMLLNSSTVALDTILNIKSHTLDSPWTERPPLAYRDARHRTWSEKEGDEGDDQSYPKTWRRRKNKLRVFLLANPYVPLVSSLVVS